MVKYETSPLDRTFAALSDPTRRAILQQLSHAGPLAVSEIARPFPVSLPGVMKHIAVLAEAGLVVREKSGRTVYCRLAAGPLEQATQWLEHYARFWSERLEALDRYLEDDPCPNDESQASPSSVTTPRRRTRSGAPGRTRRR